jgi:tetratricopeptide (TPR) repeat protein
MNRKAEAMVAVDTTLSFDPENAYSHANKGWTLLEARKTDEAITHFKEALRLEPGMEWAKAGLVSALKTKNPFYRVIFDYFLLMSRLPLASRRFVIFGLWAVNQVFVHGAVGNPAIAKVGHIFVPLYLLFCFVTWTADPLMNALLRFHPVGRYALTRKETVGANWVALSLAVSAAFGVAWLAHHRESWSFGAIGFLFVTYLVSITVTRKSKAFTVLAGLASAAVAAYVLFLSFS